MNRLKSALKNAVAFFVVGPVIGVLIYTVWGRTLTSGQDWAAWLGILWLLPFGYLLGGLPAAITGFLIGLVAQPTRPVLYLATSGVAGALAAASIALLDSSEPSSIDGVANLALIGAFASVGTAGVRLMFNLMRSTRARPGSTA